MELSQKLFQQFQKYLCIRSTKISKYQKAIENLEWT